MWRRRIWLLGRLGGDSAGMGRLSKGTVENLHQVRNALSKPPSPGGRRRPIQRQSKRTALRGNETSYPKRRPEARDTGPDDCRGVMRKRLVAGAAPPGSS